MPAVSIGEAARRSGTTPRMVRHYESLGLLPAPVRSPGNYRQYGEADLHVLRFIRRSRALGFSMAEIAELLGLWQDRGRPSARVKRIAQQHVDELERRIADLRRMQAGLQSLLDCCPGDAGPDCPILDGLAAATPA